MRNRTVVVRVVAIILCVLMVFGVIAGAVSILAHGAEYDAALAQAAPAVATGSRSGANWPVIIGVGAVALLALCIILPRFKKQPGDVPAPSEAVQPEQEKPAEPDNKPDGE